jgi:hypothetical protein
MSQARPQPDPGEMFLGCAHALQEGVSHHWYTVTDGLELSAPNGGKVRVRFFALCQACHECAAGDPLRVPLRPVTLRNEGGTLMKWYEN